MALFAIGDLHLSLSSDKPMDVFPGWGNYVSRIEENWLENIREDDTVVLAGDISWAMSLDGAKKDFRWVNNLPGNKIILKGNHDYWWTTKAKMLRFFDENGFDTLNILHNDHYQYEEFGICGTRGWVDETDEAADKRVLLREAARLETSLKSAEEAGLKPLVFLHYPPLYANHSNIEILDVMFRHDVKSCWYGHIHGSASRYAVTGMRDGIQHTLISSDYLQFNPLKIM